MPETVELIRAKLEYDINVPEATSGIDRLVNVVDRGISRLGTFETEVKDLGSAMALAMEAPRRSMADLFSLTRVGFAEMKKGGASAATGISVMGMALSQIAEQIPVIRRFAPALETVSNAGRVVSKIFSVIALRARGLEGDWTRVVRLSTNLAETVRAQTRAWRILHQTELAGMRAVIRTRELKIRQLQKVAAQTATEILELRKLGVTEAELEPRYRKIVALKRQQAELTRENARAQEELNIKQRVYGPLVQQARGHLMTLATDVRHLAARFDATGKIAEGRLADATIKAEQFKLELRRVGKAGLVPKDVLASFKDVEKMLDLLSKKAKEQGDETEKAAEKTARFGRVAGETAGKGRELATTFTSIAKTSRATNMAIGLFSPTLSSVMFKVSRVSNVFIQSFSGMTRAAKEGGSAIKIALLGIGGAFTALGAIVTGFIVKTGMLSAEVTTMEVTMRQIARNLAIKAGVDVEAFAGRIMELREFIRGLGITTREATTAITGFLRAQMPTERLIELAEAAKNFGVTVAEMSTSEVLGRFNDFIQTGNTRLMKTIGIVTTADQMHIAYGKTIGKVKEEMTGYDKLMARLEGVLKEVALTTGVYEEAMKTAGKQLSSMKRLVEEALLVLGKRFEPILAKVIFTANEFLEWFVNLSPAVLDAIASTLKWTAAIGGLAGVIMALGPILRMLIPLVKTLGLTFAKAFPWLLVIGAAIGAISLAVKVARKVWEENFGGIQDAIGSFVGMLKTSFEPILADLRFWFREIMGVIESIFRLITERLRPVFEVLTAAIVNFEGKWGKAFKLMRDAVNGFGRTVWKIFMGLAALLRGETDEAMGFLENAVIDGLTTVAIIFKNTIAKAAVWGWDLIVEFANGIMKAATALIAKVMEFVGNMIGRFWAPGSAPKAGPLSHIVEWGRGIMETFLRSFGLADFGILRDIMAPIKQALQAAVAAGTLEEKDLIPTMKGVRQSVAQLLADFRKTGKVNEEIMDGISKSLGEGGKDLTEYIRRTLDHQRALRSLTMVQDEFAQAQKAGFVPKELKDRLSAAEKEVDAAKEAVDWQREYISAMQETVDLQLQQLKLLERMANALERAAAAGKEKPGVVPETPFELIFPEIPEGKDLLGGLGLDPTKLGAVSEEFEKMREKVEKIIQAFEDWFALPWDEKLETIKTWLATAGADFIAWLEDITGWDISGWLEDFKKTLGEAWDWIVEKAKWLYTTLVGESIIPELVDRILEEFERLKIDPLGYIREKFEGISEKITGFLTKIGEVWEKITSAFAATGLAVGIALFVKFLPAFIALLPTIIPLLMGFGETIALVALYIGGFISGLAGLIAPIAAVVAAIATLAYGIYENRDQLLGFWEDFKEQISAMWTDVKPALQDIWTVLGPILKWIGIALATVAAVGFAAIISAVQSLWALVKTALPYIARIFHGAFNIIYGVIKTFILPVIDLVIAAISAMTGNSEQATSALTRAWENFKEGLGLIFSGIWEIVSNLFVGILDSVGAFVGSFLEHLVGWITKALEYFGVIDEEAGQKWRDFFDNAWEKAKTALSQIWDIIKHYWGKAYDWITKTVTSLKETWEKFWDVLQRGWAEIKKFLSPLAKLLRLLKPIFKFLKKSKDLKDFAKRLKEIWPMIRAAVKKTLVDMLERLRELGTQFWEAMKPKLMELKDRLVAWFTDTLIPALKEYARRAWQWIVDTATEAWATLEGKVSAWVSLVTIAIRAWFAQVIQYVKDNWQNWIKRISYLLGQAIGFLIKWIPKVIIGALLALPSLGYWLGKKFGELIVKFLAWVSENWPTWKEKLAEFFSNIWAGIVVFLTETLPEWIGDVSTWFGELIAKFLEWVGVNLPIWITALAEWFGKLVAGVITFLTETLPEWIGKFATWMGELWDGFMEYMSPENRKKRAEAFWGKVKEILTATFEFLTTTLPEWIATLGDWFVDLWEGFIEWLPEAIETAGKLWKALMDWLGEYVIAPFVKGVLEAGPEWLKDFVKIGAEIVAQIKQGIIDIWPATIEWFKGKIADLVDLFPRFSEPKDRTSPLFGLSKAGEGIVKNIMEGMGNVDVSGAFSAQLAGMTGQLGNATTNINRSRTSIFERGAFENAFPGVTEGSEAETFLTILDETIGRSRSLSQIGA